MLDSPISKARKTVSTEKHIEINKYTCIYIYREREPYMVVTVANVLLFSLLFLLLQVAVVFFYSRQQFFFGFSEEKERRRKKRMQ